MATAVKEPKPKDLKQSEAGAASTVESAPFGEIQYPPAGCTARVAECREVLCRELKRRGEDPKLLKQIDIEVLCDQVVSLMAQEIKKAIDECPTGNLPTLKQRISKASEFNGARLLTGSSFTGRTEDSLRSATIKEWEERVSGEIKTRVVLEKPSEVTIKDTLTGLVSSKDHWGLIEEIKGYKWVSNVFCQGRMLRAHILMSAACKLARIQFNELGWEAAFPGTTEQFDTLVTELKDVTARERYLGLEGYKRFSESWAGKDMQKGYTLLSAVCKFTKDVNFDDFGWEAQFPGTTEQFDTLVTELKDVTARERYLGLKGYKKFSESWAGKDMQKGYILLSAVCALCGDRKLFSALNWPAPFSGTVKQFDFIHTTLSELGERLDPLKGVSKDYRLVALHELLQRLPKGELIADLPVEALFAALPERIGSLNRGDFSTACMRLTVSVDGTQRNIYFDSAPERVCGYLLLKYGVIAEFKEGQNLHVCPTVGSRISLDFLVSGQNGDPVFIEYHPLSRREREAGLSLEDAGVRKMESVKGGEYNDATVHHIWDVEDLYKILQQCTMKNPPASFEQFRQDIKEAEALGRKLDREDAGRLEEMLEKLHIELC